MDYSVDNGLFINALEDNLLSKTTKSNQEKTNKYLKTLYSFDNEAVEFKGFVYYWKMSEENDKSLLALLYALGRDFLLAESAETILKVPVGEKVKVEAVEEALESFHPNRFTAKTRKSVAQNLISSWKQAGYIIGKVRGIRTKTNPTYSVVAFAMLLAYLDQKRGELILQSKWVRALDLSETKVRELAVEAARHDLVQYQFAGSVTVISFEKFLSNL